MWADMDYELVETFPIIKITSNDKGKGLVTFQFAYLLQLFAYFH